MQKLFLALPAPALIWIGYQINWDLNSIYILIFGILIGIWIMIVRRCRDG